MGEYRVMVRECDGCGLELRMDGRNPIMAEAMRYQPPTEAGPELAMWVHVNNWRTQVMDWHAEDGTYRRFSYTTCPKCTWEDIKDWPSQPYDESEMF